MAASPLPEQAVVLFAHGARDPQWAEPFQRIRQAVQAQLPEVVVDLAFLELMEPRLPALIDMLEQEGIREITLVPLFMAQGSHLRQDLPRMVGELQVRHPHLAFTVTSAIGDSPELIGSIARWVANHHLKLG